MKFRIDPRKQLLYYQAPYSLAARQTTPTGAFQAVSLYINLLFWSLVERKPSAVNKCGFAYHNSYAGKQARTERKRAELHSIWRIVVSYGSVTYFTDSQNVRYKRDLKRPKGHSESKRYIRYVR